MAVPLRESTTALFFTSPIVKGVIFMDKFKDPVFRKKFHEAALKAGKYLKVYFRRLAAPQRQMESETEMCIEYLQDKET